MPRGTIIDLSEPARIDTVDILPSPPPAYARLPEEVVEQVEGEAAEDFDEDDDDEDDEEEDEDYDDYEEEEERGLYDSTLVGDQDWENASGDLTKRYNRLRQHVGALTGQAGQQSQTAGVQDGKRSAAGASAGLLPAQNVRYHNTSQARTSATPSASAASSTTGVHASKMDSSLAQLSHKYASQLNLSGTTSSAPTHFEPSFTSNASTRKGGSERRDISKDKSDRATTEQVLDPRTRLVLLKMLGRGLLELVEGCVSTGKEANVYHALGRIHPEAEPPSPLVHFAIKIYKTSILTFKTRSKYLTGEFRFKGGYSKVKNPRKMVRLWAEKEMRNLKRLKAEGLRCPEAVEVRGNVLVMTFLGKGDDGWEASPRLKDATLPADRMDDLYVEALLIIRRMYKNCRLVHADLSEYNILYTAEDEEDGGHLVVIDVSQSVEHDHPHAFDFLRSDIANIDEFFARRGVKTLGIQRTFGLAVEEWGKDKESRETEEEIREEMERRFAIVEEPKTAEEGVEGQDEGGEDGEREEQDRTQSDAVFKQSYIPRTLNEVYDIERDVARVSKGEKDALIYAQVAGVVAPKSSTPQPTEAKSASVRFTDEAAAANGEADETSSMSDSEGESDDEDTSGSDSGSWQERTPRGKKHEDKDSKKERKAAVKEEKREKRKEKIPKSVKKAKIKKTSGKKK